MTFAMLPAELRSLIWEFALPKPRSHVVKSNQMTKKKKIPVLFQINHESREFALKHMPLLFDGTNLAGCDDYHFNYFNPKIDTLCLYDMAENFNFFMGPRYHTRTQYYGRITYHGKDRNIDCPEIAPIKECDMVRSIEISRWTPHKDFLLSKTGYFRNLERVIVRFRISSGDYNCKWPGPSLANEAYRVTYEMLRDGADYYAFFWQQVELGNIAVILDVVFIMTRADVQCILSTGGSTFEFSGTRTVMNKAVEKWLDL